MSERKPESKGGRFAVLLTSSIVSSLIMLDSNIVAVALPTIGRSLKGNFTDNQWVISAYVLTYTALLLAAGNFADLRGRRLAVLVGLGIFAAASVGCGLAPSVLFLCVARAIQGIGGALLLTASMAIISTEFQGDARPKAYAFWGASLGVALASGPLVGGAITHFLGWRWIFLINVPGSLALILATIKWVPESKDPSAKNLDVPGIVTFSAGLALVIWTLIEGNDAGWTSAGSLIRLAIAAALFAAFVVIEGRLKHPMVALDLFGSRTFNGAVFAMIGYGASAQVMVFFLPQYLENTFKFGALTAGVAMLPFALPIVIMPRVSAGLEAVYSGRLLLTLGLIAAAVGNILLWLLASAGTSYLIFAGAMAIAGAAAGILQGQTVKVLQGAVPQSRAGMGSGIASTTRYVGILVSVALLGSILSRTVKGQFISEAQRAGLPSGIAASGAQHVTSGDLAGMLAMIPANLRSTLSSAGAEAFAHGFAAAGLAAAVIALFCAGFAYWLIDADETSPQAYAGDHKPKRHLVDCRTP